MSAHSADHSAQSHYQVRFALGAEGLDALLPAADAVVWVDALGVDPVRDRAASAGIPAVEASLRNRTAVAEWVLARQVEKGGRLAVAVVASGPGADDVLAAGAVIDALAALGLDFASPEAAVCCGAFTALRRAAAHLVSASVAGRELADQGRGDEVAAAGRIDSETVLSPLA